MRWHRLNDGWLVLVATTVLLGSSSCTSTLWFNNTAVRSGNVTIIFINNTAYRASFTSGTWDPLNKNPAGDVNLEQLRLEANTQSSSVTLSCARSFSIGTQALYDRLVATKAFESTTFDSEAFDTTVHFSDAPTDSDLAASATVGTAQGIELLLGVDYNCTDQLMITFEQDPDAPGGFRIDFADIRTTAL